MRRVKRFMETNKMAHEKLNAWLEENPQALLVSVKPIVIDPMTEIIYAIVDIPQNEKPIGAKGKAKEGTQTACVLIRTACLIGESVG